MKNLSDQAIKKIKEQNDQRSNIEQDLTVLKEKLKDQLSILVDDDLYGMFDNEKVRAIYDTIDDIIATKRILVPIQDLFYLKILYRFDKEDKLGFITQFHFEYPQEVYNQMKRKLSIWLGRVISDSILSNILECLADIFYNKSNLMVDQIWLTKEMEQKFNNGEYRLFSIHPSRYFDRLSSHQQYRIKSFINKYLEAQQIDSTNSDEFLTELFDFVNTPEKKE